MFVFIRVWYISKEKFGMMVVNMSVCVKMLNMDIIDVIRGLFIIYYIFKFWDYDFYLWIIYKNNGIKLYWN